MYFPTRSALSLVLALARLWTLKEMIPENQLRGSFILEGEKINIEIYFKLSLENPPLIRESHIRELPKEKY
jgi:hypothetical protein